MDSKEIEKNVKKVEADLGKAPTYLLGSCTPGEGEAYSCLNCRRFDHERDGCFTEWMERYGYKLQKDRCPGYDPPEDGEFVMTISGPIDVVCKAQS